MALHIQGYSPGHIIIDPLPPNLPTGVVRDYFSQSSRRDARDLFNYLMDHLPRNTWLALKAKFQEDL